jgi:hypothetical protein
MLPHNASEALGAFLGAEAADLVYVTDVTLGLNIVARSLPLAPRGRLTGRPRMGTISLRYSLTAQVYDVIIRGIRKTMRCFATFGALESLWRKEWPGFSETETMCPSSGSSSLLYSHSFQQML